jgi:hypothetical protein
MEILLFVGLEMYACIRRNTHGLQNWVSSTKEEQRARSLLLEPFLSLRRRLGVKILSEARILCWTGIRQCRLRDDGTSGHDFDRVMIENDGLFFLAWNLYKLGS